MSVERERERDKDSKMINSLPQHMIQHMDCKPLYQTEEMTIACGLIS